MYRCSLKLATILACAAALSLAGQPAAAQWGWVDITDQSGGTGVLGHVDTMVLSDGTPVVGYSESGLLPTLSFVEGRAVRDVASNLAGRAARFQADRFGIISYVSHLGSQTTVYGSDLGTRQTLTAEYRFEAEEFGPTGFTGLALDQGGVPTLVAQGTPGTQHFVITEFDVASASWQPRTIPAFLEAENTSATSAAYTADGRLVIASTSSADFQLLIEQPDGQIFGFAEEIGSGNVLSYALTTRDNQIAFAYNRLASASATIGVYDGTSFSFNDFNTPTRITPGSLAFDPDGTLWFSHIDENTGQVLLTEQTGPDSWATQSLGTTGQLASLAFADDGTPYVSVSEHTGIRLYSTALNIPGDLNGDDQVDQQDLTLVLLGFGSNAADGDTNGDGVTDYDDLTATLRNWTSELEPVFAVPEPGTGAAMLLLITAGLVRRRSSSRR